MPQIHVLPPSEGFTEILCRHVVPLFADARRDRSEQIGTGLLVRNGDDVFVVSAAHVLDQARKLFMYVGRYTIRSLDGPLRLTPTPISGMRRDDKVDIGVIKLSRKNLPPYSDINKDAISLARLESRALPRDNKKYLLLGFPASGSKVKYKTRDLYSLPEAYFTSLTDYNLYTKLKLFPFEHIVLPFDPNDLAGPDGIKKRMPPLRGMSGAPIFTCGPRRDVSTAEQARVAGIFIAQPLRSNALIGTDICTAVAMIKSLG